MEKTFSIGDHTISKPMLEEQRKQPNIFMENNRNTTFILHEWI